MKLLDEKKAQGSMEYIAIAGGAIAVALIIGYTLKQIAGVLTKRGTEAAGTAAGGP